MPLSSHAMVLSVVLERDFVLFLALFLRIAVGRRWRGRRRCLRHSAIVQVWVKLLRLLPGCRVAGGWPSRHAYFLERVPSLRFVPLPYANRLRCG